MKTIKYLARIGCIWVTMNVYAQTIRLAKDMIQAIHIYGSMDESMREDTGGIAEDMSETIADVFTNGVIIGIEIENYPTLTGILIRLLPGASEPFREVNSEAFQTHESSSTAQDIHVYTLRMPDKTHARSKHTICYFSALDHKVYGLVRVYRLINNVKNILLNRHHKEIHG